MSKEETKLKAIRMNVSLIKKIEDRAKKENRNFSNMVITILMNELDKK